MKAVRDIKKGDIAMDGSRAIWTALEDAQPNCNGGIFAHVIFPDGGDGYRIWDEPDFELNIQTADTLEQ